MTCVTVTAEAVIAAQLAAHNERDLDAFMSHWAADAKLIAWPDRLVADGAAAIRALHAERFAQPHLHAMSLARTVVGSLVIDHELVTRTVHDRPEMVEHVGIYEVTDGRIRRALFRRAKDE